MLKRLIDRPVTVTMGLLVIITLGLVSIHRLPISLIPDIDIPKITVQVSATELSAKEIEETVLKPLRQNLIQINSLEDIESEAVDGNGIIRMTFAHGTDMDYIFIEANEKIDRAMPSLGDIGRPKVIKSGASDIPAFYLNLTSKSGTDFQGLSLFASEVISKRIEQLPEVAMVDISGCVYPEILIIPDETMLKQTGIGLDEFEEAVKAANISLGNLSIRDGEYRYSVKFQSFASDKEDIENIRIKKEGRVYQLKDLASVIQQPEARIGMVRSEGKEAVTMAVIKQSDAKMSDLKKSMDVLVSQFINDYPEIDFKSAIDQTELLEYSINNLQQNIIVGIILACIIIFLFMQDFKSPGLVALTIPTALIFSMLVFHLAGLTINIISLSGLLLGVGMMVDNTIILTDNITARWQRGDSLRYAVLKGTSEVIAPMLSSVLTTCAVFIPLIFVSGIAGAMFYDQAMAITIVLLTAYVITITVIPVYYWCWYRRQPAFVPNRFLSKFSFGRVIGFYEKGVKWLIGHRSVSIAVFVLSIVGIIFCFIYMPKTKLPEISYSDTLMKIEWPDGISLEQNTDRVVAIENALKGDAIQITSLIGAQQFLLEHSVESSPTGAVIYIKCENTRSLDNVKERLVAVMDSEWPEAEFAFEPSGNIFDMVFSDEEGVLVAKFRPASSSWIDAAELETLLHELSLALPDIPVRSPALKKDLLYMADTDRMALYGVTYGQLTDLLENSLNQNLLFTIVQGSRPVPVVMGTDKKSLEEIIGSSFIVVDDIEIPVSSLMRQTWTEDLRNITAGTEGVYYPLELQVDDRMAETVMATVRDVVKENGNFEVGFDGSHFSNRNMINELLLTLAISIILLYLILASQFESLVQPLIILSEIVIDIFFALVVLWLCGVSINLMSLIGLIVVCGIVINDSILKIDTINKLRKDGFVLDEAILEAGQRRLKAIIMTSLTTILSVCPFLARGSMGDDLQYPMSIVIIAGMTAGTVISLFIVPVLYHYVYYRKK